MWRAIAYDISAAGIGLALPRLLQHGAALTVEAWQLPGTSPVVARVAHNKLIEGVWFTGCRFDCPLPEEELSIWRRLSADWLAQGKPS